MTYQEEKQVRLRRRGSRQAVALAMQGRWREAIAVNESLIENFPHDVDAYNRLGKAYMGLGDYARAKEIYRRAVEIDPYNAIARKNLHRLSRLGQETVALEGGSDRAEPQHFIEEIGKAAVVELYNLAPPEVLVRMMAGDMVYLKIEGSGLAVENGRQEYLGKVSPKYGQRLLRLMEGGNKYSAAVVALREDSISVIIREVYQDPSQIGQLSFPSRRFEGFQPNVGDKILRRELEDEELLVETLGHTAADKEEAGVPGESIDRVEEE